MRFLFNEPESYPHSLTTNGSWVFLRRGSNKNTAELKGILKGFPEECSEELVSESWISELGLSSFS